jgi:peptidyl-prolyl cis-trans isomerase D
MPIMTRMRDNMPLILFLLLIAFLITIVFEWGMDYLGLRSGQRDHVGVINGRKITYQQYNDIIKGMADQQKQQTGQEPNDAEYARLREQAWQGLISQTVVEDEIARLGITVTNKEISDWVYGDTPPEDIKRFFVDSTGQFQRAAFEDFLRDPNKYIQDPRGENPQYGSKWLADYEKNLRQRRLQEKLQSVLTASVRVGEGELLQRYLDQSRMYNAAYAAFDANALVKDEEVTVTDGDLRALYEENIEQYKTEASRTLTYVTFVEAPSPADSAGALTDIQDAAAKAAAGTDFIELTATYNERPDSGVVFARGELSPELDAAVFAAGIGQVVGPVHDAQGYHLAKILGETKGKDEQIRVRHILFPMTGDTNAVRATAAAVLKELKAGKDFALLARAHSKDGSAAAGGDLGWVKKGRMVPAFDRAAFGARTGEIVGPVRTQFGLHLIRVDGRDNRTRKIAMINSLVAPSSRTKSDLIDRARDFGATVRESDIATQAKQFGFQTSETTVQEKGGFVPGIGVNEAIPRWAFGASLGQVSEPVAVPGGHAVFVVTGVREAGVRPFDEVKESLRPATLRKKKITRALAIASDLRAKLGDGDGVRKIAELNPSIPVQETGPFSMASVPPGIGRDPGFLGTVAAMKVGAVSRAVEGTRGAYIIQLLSVSEFDSTTYASQRSALQDRLLQEKRSRFFNDWLEGLKESAEVTDNRSLF